MLYQPKALQTKDIEPRPILKDITLVIPTLGRAILEECLHWIIAGSAWPGSLIVVDQGSRQQVGAWTESLRSLDIGAQYVPSSQRGKSAGINRGLERVNTRFVAVTDDDCFVTPDWLGEMTSHLRRKPEAIITGRVLGAGDDALQFSVATSRIPETYNHPQFRVHPLIGANMGMTVASVERIGLFDEHPCLGCAAEDIDYGYRALRLGIPIVYDPEIVLYHHHWRDAEQRITRYHEYARGVGGFYGTHLLDGDWIIPLQALRDLIRGPVRWLRGWLKRDQDMIDRGRADSLNLLPGILAGMRRRGIS